MSEQVVATTLEEAAATATPLLDSAVSFAGRIADYAASQMPSGVTRVLQQIAPSLNNPVHLALLGVAGYFGYRIVVSATSSSDKPDRFSMSKISAKKVPAKRTFTPHQLAECNGKDEDTPLYVGVNGIVYDVSQSRGFYGPGGPYANFAGRDASRGLAIACFDASVLTSLDDPIDNLEDLDQAEKDSLDEWAEFFAGKYVPVGRLVAPEPGTSSNAEKKQDAEEKPSDKKDDADEEKTSS
ncbi:Dihydrodipicolinate synthase [Coemansia sp. RSA 1939]|nr:Dihydrodipicolinate synthase [Coemansia sp. RSA 1939]